jgi:hypothetical protein
MIFSYNDKSYAGCLYICFSNQGIVISLAGLKGFNTKNLQNDT